MGFESHRGRVDVCRECCVSGRGLCDELITRPEESYRLLCVVVCDLEKITLVNDDEGQERREKEITEKGLIRK